MSALHSTSSIGEVQIALRDDLLFRPQRYSGQSCYLIEDPHNGSFFRVGVAEYTFISLLDGNVTVRDAMHQTTSVLGREAFSEQDVAAICKWLVDSGLAKTRTSGESRRLQQDARTKLRHRRRQWFNPLVTKIPVFNPQRLLDAMAPWLQRLTSTPAFVAWLLLLVLAAHQLLTHWNQIPADSSQILGPANWLWLLMTWLGLKFIHETFHALVCRKYGGEVREAGVVLIVFAPIFYVDVTSSWRFPSKWQRIFTASAGMYSELFVGAVATLVWANTGPGMTNQVALNVMLLSTVTTVLFNANPLMRFDGYYILADLIEIPNLAPQGQQFLSYLRRRYLFGVELSPPAGPWRQAWTVRVYGVAAFLWRIFITVCIAITAATLFHGAGTALVLLASVFWVGAPLYRTARYLVAGQDHERPNRLHFSLVSTSLLALSATVLTLCPWPWAVEAPAVVDYHPRAVVRADASGFVKQVLVQPGQYVQRGATLAVLQSVQLQMELRAIEHAFDASRIRSRVHGSRGDIAAQQSEGEALRSLQLRRDELRQQVAGLEIKAPMAGQIITNHLDALVGTFVQTGQELLSIGDETQKELVLSIAQEDGKLFRAMSGRHVEVKMRGGNREAFSVEMVAVDPRATTQFEYLALTAAGGGPLPVRSRSPSDEHASEDAWEFVQPRLTGSIPLAADRGATLHAGQLATVRLPTSRGALGICLYRCVDRWVRTRLRALAG